MRRCGFISVLATLTIITVFATYFTLWTSPLHGQRDQELHFREDIVITSMVNISRIPSHQADVKYRLPKGLKRIRHNEKILIDDDTEAGDAEVNFFKYVYQLHVGCTPTTRLGNVGDGGWNICVASIFDPPPKCLVYSFGINYDWSFDDSVAGMFGCIVRSFDPSMKEVQEHRRGHLIWFYNTGLGGLNEIDSRTGWTMHTFGSYLKMHGEEFAIIDYLKLDVEYSEWASLEAMIQEGSLSRVKQLGFELHTRESLPGNPATHAEDFVRYYKILARLEAMGFMRWSSHFNPQGVYQSKRTGSFVTCCYEVVYINANFLPGRINPMPKLNISSPINLPGLDYGSPPAGNMHPSPLAHLPVAAIPPDDVLDDNDVVLAPGFHRVPLPRGMHINIRTGMEPYNLESQFLQFIYIAHINCPKSRRFGNKGDGGWDICLTDPYSLKPPCLVYSFGIGNDWSFDDSISEDYGCQVHSFDPTMKAKEHKRSELVHFYPVGINGTKSISRRGWRMNSLANILHGLNHTEVTIDVLKIDVEYSEWSALNTSFTEGSLRMVKQLVFEMHTREMDGPTKHASSEQDIVFYWEVLNHLEMLGFRRWKTHLNTNGRYQSERSNRVVGCCFELYYLNLHFMEDLIVLLRFVDEERLPAIGEMDEGLTRSRIAQIIGFYPAAINFVNFDQVELFISKFGCGAL